MYGPIAFFLISKTPEENIIKDETDKASHKRLFEIAKVRNIDIRYVLGEDSYDDGDFTNYWIFEGDRCVHIKEKFTPKIIYAKHSSSLFDHAVRVNNTFLEEISVDKLLTAQTFPQFSKKTVLIDEHTLSNLTELKTDKAVLKPRDGANGRNVKVLNKAEVTADEVKDDTYIAQELIDSSGGIPGLVSQRHEMRIYVFNNMIHSAYLRLPPDNSYLCNIAQGAIEKQITLEQIPTSFITVVAEVDKKFSSISPRHYTVDIMNEDNTPWIVELNNTPGLPDIKVQPLADGYFNALLDVLVGNEIRGIKLN